MGRKRIYPKAEDYPYHLRREFVLMQEYRRNAKEYLHEVQVHLSGIWLQRGESPLRVFRLYSRDTQKACYDLNPPTDFLHLTACFCARLVPVGVWTDRFEELFPEQTEVVEFLRRWEERKREIDSYGPN